MTNDREPEEVVRGNEIGQLRNHWTKQLAFLKNKKIGDLWNLLSSVGTLTFLATDPNSDVGH